MLSDEEAAERGRLGRVRPAGGVEAPVSLSAPPEAPPEAPPQGEREPVFLEREGKPSRLPPGFPPYVKKGNDDTDLSRFALGTASSKARQKSKLIMVEGKRLVQEAFNAKLTPKALFFSRVDDVVSLQLPPKQFALQKVTYEKLQRWSRLTTSSGVIGFFQMPNLSNQKSASVFPFSIICDNVRDPGNLGSIIRIAASAGCENVFLSKGCVDLWNDKVLRSGMGAHFYTAIKENMEWSDIETHLKPNSYIMFADSNGADLSTYEDEDDVFVGSDLDTQSMVSFEQEHHVKDFSNRQTGLEDLPVFPYYQVDYSQMECMYLVVGGETGISTNAAHLGKIQKKIRLNIPMLNNVESLSVSSAVAILAHEIKRQIELGVSASPDEEANTIIKNVM